MVQVEALRLFVLGIDDQRVNGNFGPTGALYGIPQQGASEFAPVAGARNGKAPQPCDGHRGIAWQTLGESDWHLREKDPSRSQCVKPGNPIYRDLAGHKTRGDAAAHILAGLLPKIAIERVHPTRKLRAIMAGPKRLNEE
jgi:hypothetical protein